MMLAGYSLKNL